MAAVRLVSGGCVKSMCTVCLFPAKAVVLTLNGDESYPKSKV